METLKKKLWYELEQLEKKEREDKRELDPTTIAFIYSISGALCNLDKLEKYYKADNPKMDNPKVMEPVKIF